MSINNHNLMDYPHALETKDTSDVDIFVSFSEKSISCDINSDYFIASLNDKQDGFNFNRICFSFLDSNISSPHANFFLVSQLTRYVGTCSNYDGFIIRIKRLPAELLVK